MPTRHKRLVVPYVRGLKVGTTGSDVVAVHRALKRAGYPVSGATTKYTPQLAAAVKVFKHDHPRLWKHPSGNYGPRIHKRLVYQGDFDAYGAKLMHAEHLRLEHGDVRAEIVSTAMFARAHAPRAYLQRRPMLAIVHKIRPPHMWEEADCSEFATWCYWVAGGPDPNGLHFNGAGYTGTLLQHGHVVSEGKAKPGDLALYSGNGGHVVVLVGKVHGVWMVVSHGHAGGPYYTNLHYRTDLIGIRNYID